MFLDISIKNYSPLLLNQQPMLVSMALPSITLSKSAVCATTGMSYEEINSFLCARNLSHSGNRIAYEALPELEEWYLKKMRRYFRNALFHQLNTGSSEESIFLEFCSTYRKLGHQNVNSWEDIDETRILLDFREECLGLDPIFGIELRSNESLLSKIQREFLFHLRFKKTAKYGTRLIDTYLSFILCNRYHIFTGEEDSNANNPLDWAISPFVLRVNSPKSLAPDALAS